MPGAPTWLALLAALPDDAIPERKPVASPELIASGQADVWIEPSAKAWDLCPMKVIVEEAGGKFFNFEGTDSIYAGNALVCTPAFEQLLRDTFVKPA